MGLQCSPLRSTLHRAGCDPIIFAGAVSPTPARCCTAATRSSRGPGAPWAARRRARRPQRRIRQRDTCHASDIDGELALTTPHLVQFRDWLVSRSNEVVERRILNATGAGILHGGRITQIDLAALALTGPDLDLAARLATVWRESATHSLRAWPTLEDTLVRPDSDGIPLETWLDFAGDTASAEQIIASTGPGWRAAPAITMHPAAAAWSPMQPIHGSGERRSETAVQWQAAAAACRMYVAGATADPRSRWPRPKAAPGKVFLATDMAP